MTKDPMKRTSLKRTICEVCRECNDILQKNYIAPNEHLLLKKKIAVIQKMAKRMNAKLVEYKENWDKGFWKDNTNFDRAKRLRGLK